MIASRTRRMRNRSSSETCWFSTSARHSGSQSSQVCARVSTWARMRVARSPLALRIAACVFAWAKAWSAAARLSDSRSGKRSNSERTE